MRVLHRTKGERACGTVSRNRAKWGGALWKLKGGRNPKDGRWLAEPIWHAVGGTDVVQVTAMEGGWDWRDVVDGLERDGLGVDQTQARRVTGVRGRAQFEWPGCENDQGGFIKLMWHEIMKKSSIAKRAVTTEGR